MKIKLYNSQLLRTIRSFDNKQGINVLIRRHFSLNNKFQNRMLFDHLRYLTYSDNTRQASADSYLITHSDVVYGICRGLPSDLATH